jgi:APA family basic amino acid/polyamine antiporter
VSHNLERPSGTEPQISVNPKLDRVITLPALIFYGLGVTVGAGIFALLGEILGLAGDNAPLSFLVAGVLASFTGASYMMLIAAFPRAGSEAVYVNQGIGPTAGRLTGLAVVVTGIITGAVVALAFAGYLSSLVRVPERPAAVALLVVLSLVARKGIRESVILAAVITLLEVGTLVVVLAFGFDLLDTPGLLQSAFVPSIDTAVISPILAGSVIAFFAFVGFENIANLAEETIEPRRAGPIAILVVLLITLGLYVLLALVAVAVPDRAAITESSAPMASLFEEVSDRGSGPIAAAASVAMINGILIQIVMAARVLYGMATDGLILNGFAHIHPKHQTPTRATLFVTLSTIALVLLFPLVQLARITSLVTLGVFTLVNTALYLIGRKQEATPMARFRWVGLVGATLSLALAGWQIFDGLG